MGGTPQPSPPPPTRSQLSSGDAAASTKLPSGVLREMELGHPPGKVSLPTSVPENAGVFNEKEAHTRSSKEGQGGRGEQVGRESGCWEVGACWELGQSAGPPQPPVQRGESRLKWIPTHPSTAGQLGKPGPDCSPEGSASQRKKQNVSIRLLLPLSLQLRTAFRNLRALLSPAASSLLFNHPPLLSSTNTPPNTRKTNPAAQLRCRLIQPSELAF